MVVLCWPIANMDCVSCFQACKASGVHMGVSTGDAETVAQVMKRVDNKGWVHIGIDMALLVGAVDNLFDGVRSQIQRVARL